jgi:transcriptional regulator with XRE-family HTH domain
MDSFAKRLRHIRTAATLNRTAFAKSLGVSAAHISALEKEKGSPSDQFIKSVAGRYGYSEKWLSTGVGEMRESDFKSDGRIEMVVRMDKPEYDKHGGHKPDFEKSMGVEKGSDEWESIGLLYEIVKDGDHAYRRAIIANLVAFSTAIRERKKREELESEVAGLKADQEKNAGETEKLRQELNELREIVKSQARAEAYTGPERRITAGKSPDGIEHRRAYVPNDENHA